MNDKENLIALIAGIGIVGALYFATKSEFYRKAAIKNRIAFDTVNNLMFEASKRIDDSDKLAEFEAMKEHNIKFSGTINKYAV
jgi:hypothetical protein